MNIPAGLKYTKEHEWVKAEGDAVTIGITDYAQGELGDIIFIDFTHSLGQEVNKGDVVGSIEAVKTVSEIYSPVSGTIQDINDSINDNVTQVNTDPYSAGWLIKVKHSNNSELDELLSDDEYKQLISA